MRTKTRDKMQAIQLEEQKWKREHDGALALAERDRVSEPELQTLIKSRNQLMKDQANIKQQQQESAKELGKVLEQIKDYLMAFIPEDLREEA